MPDSLQHLTPVQVAKLCKTLAGAAKRLVATRRIVLQLVSGLCFPRSWAALFQKELSVVECQSHLSAVQLSLLLDSCSSLQVLSLRLSRYLPHRLPPALTHLTVQFTRAPFFLGDIPSDLPSSLILVLAQQQKAVRFLSLNFACEKEVLLPSHACPKLPRTDVCISLETPVHLDLSWLRQQQPCSKLTMRVKLAGGEEQEQELVKQLRQLPLNDLEVHACTATLNPDTQPAWGQVHITSSCKLLFDPYGNCFSGHSGHTMPLQALPSCPDIQVMDTHEPRHAACRPPRPICITWHALTSRAAKIHISSSCRAVHIVGAAGTAPNFGGQAWQLVIHAPVGVQGLPGANYQGGAIFLQNVAALAAGWTIGSQPEHADGGIIELTDSCD